RYMVEKLKKYGYADARAEPFNYNGWRRGPVKLEMKEPLEREFEAISLAMSPGGEVDAEVIDLGTGSPEEFEAVDPKDVEGKIVMCSSATSPRGKRVHRRTKYGYAVEYGAVGFIFMNHNPGQLPPTGSLRPSYRMGGEIPGVGVSLETGSHMLRLAKDKPLRVRLSDGSEVIPDTMSANIVAELPGETDEWIVVGGHYERPRHSSGRHGQPQRHGGHHGAGPRLEAIQRQAEEGDQVHLLRLRGDRRHREHLLRRGPRRRHAQDRHHG
ncbi:hypothetical protein KAW53_05650, partial [Candidatus Bathyarchaeota archaeon]|nr:hypothetical protein [Candidatus Bathyarchaeota archaeon]